MRLDRRAQRIRPAFPRNDSLGPAGQTVAAHPRGRAAFQGPNNITAVGVTPALMPESGQARTEPILLGIDINGNYGVIYSPLGLLSQSPYARGVNDVSAIQIGQNVMMYAVTH